MTTEEPKWKRNRLAKAELWLHLAVTAQRWADDLQGTSERTLPPERWPADDPFIELCRAYELTPDELGRLAGKIAAELENRALRAGYEEVTRIPEGP